MLTGTIVNALAVLAGSVAGLFLTWLARHFSRYLPANSAALGERLQTSIMQAWPCACCSWASAAV